jgi:hypothetical protein
MTPVRLRKPFGALPTEQVKSAVTPTQPSRDMRSEVAKSLVSGLSIHFYTRSSKLHVARFCNQAGILG